MCSPSQISILWWPRLHICTIIKLIEWKLSLVYRMIDSSCESSKMCPPQNETKKMIVDISKNNTKNSKAYTKMTTQTQSSNHKADVVNLATFSSKKDDESALERILTRANKQTW